MSTTLKNTRFIRQTLQGRTLERVSTTAMDAAVQQAYDVMKGETWCRVDDKVSSLPRHNWAQTGFLPTFDAATYCGDYANGYQHAYACAVCYTYKVPATALDASPTTIRSVAIPALGDRWLAPGFSMGVWVSASVTPPTWEAVLAGTNRSDVKTAQMAVTPSNSGTDSSATITFDWSGAPKTALAYVHIVVYLTDYLVHRGAWIEGGAMIDGANISWEFTENGMTADATVEFDDPVVAPTYVDLPFGYPDMPLRLGSSVALREISYRYERTTGLTALGGGSTLLLAGVSMTSIQTGMATPPAASIEVTGKASGAVSIASVAGDDILEGSPYYEDNVGTGRVGYVRANYKRSEPASEVQVFKVATFNVTNEATTIGCSARLSVPAKARLFAREFWDSTQTAWTGNGFASTNSLLYGFSMINCRAVMSHGLDLTLNSPNFGTGGSLSLAVGGTFAYNESVFGLDWTPYISYNGYSACTIKGTPASAGSMYCGRYVTLTIGSHTCTFGIRWVSVASTHSSYSSHQY